MEAQAAKLIITLVGRSALSVTEPMIEVASRDETWQRHELTATELVAEPSDDVPWDGTSRRPSHTA